MAPRGTEIETAAVGRLEQERYTRGYRTIKHFAEASGVHRHTLTAIERGQSDPTLSTIRRIASTLGVAVDEVTRWIEEGSSTTAESADDQREAGAA